MIKKTKAGLAAKALAKAISAMIDLMYQNDTAFRFIKAFKTEIDKEYTKRKGLANKKA